MEHQVHLDQVVAQVHQVLQEQTVLPAQTEHQEVAEHQVQMVQTEPQVQMVLVEQMVHQAQMVLQELQVQMAPQVHLQKHNTVVHIVGHLKEMDLY